MNGKEERAVNWEVVFLDSRCQGAGGGSISRFNSWAWAGR